MARSLTLTERSVQSSKLWRCRTKSIITGSRLTPEESLAYTL
ncbi:MAG: hypothetical protein QW839_01985 [Conexivisphaerales archaeon]